MTRHDSIYGCIIGGAIGDSIGVPYEGIEPGASLPVELLPYRLSDDTQMTLATCEAIADAGVDPSRIATTFLEWYQADRFCGIGASTYSALQALSDGAHWATAGRVGEYGAGNGAAMRIAPLAYHVHPDDRPTIRDIVRITHHHDEAYVGALAVLYAIALRDQLGESTLVQIIDKLPDTAVRDRLLIYEKCEDSIAEAGKKFGASGYVVDSVPLAIYAATKVREFGFKKMIRELILAGGDTDTTCSISGQIAGAAIGFSDLPQNLIKALPERDVVLSIVEKFTNASVEDD